MKFKQLTLRVPSTLKTEALLIVLQAATGHVPSAVASAKRNAMRLGVDVSKDVTEADFRAAVQFLQLAATTTLASIMSPAAVVNGSSTAMMQIASIGGETGNDL